MPIFPFELSEHCSDDRESWVWVLAPHLGIEKWHSHCQTLVRTTLWGLAWKKEYQSWVVGRSQEKNEVRLLHGSQMALGISHSGWAIYFKMDEKGPHRVLEGWGCHVLLSSMCIGMKGWECSPLHTGDNIGPKLLSSGRRLRECQDCVFQVLLHFLCRLWQRKCPSMLAAFTVREWLL